eukprot:PhF_6_TR25147/c0_g2_i1/m.34640
MSRWCQYNHPSAFFSLMGTHRDEYRPPALPTPSPIPFRCPKKHNTQSGLFSEVLPLGSGRSAAIAKQQKKSHVQQQKCDADDEDDELVSFVRSSSPNPLQKVNFLRSQAHVSPTPSSTILPRPPSKQRDALATAARGRPQHTKPWSYSVVPQARSFSSCSDSLIPPPPSPKPPPPPPTTRPDDVSQQHQRPWSYSVNPPSCFSNTSHGYWTVKTPRQPVELQRRKEKKVVVVNQHSQRPASSASQGNPNRSSPHSSNPSPALQLQEVLLHVCTSCGTHVILKDK